MFVVNLSVCPWQASPTKYWLWARPGAYQRLEHLKGSSIGKAPAFPIHIRLGWKGLPRGNTLAFYENSKLTAVKSFMTLAPEVLETWD